MVDIAENINVSHEYENATSRSDMAGTLKEQVMLTYLCWDVVADIVRATVCIVEPTTSAVCVTLFNRIICSHLSVLQAV